MGLRRPLPGWAQRLVGPGQTTLLASTAALLGLCLPASADEPAKKATFAQVSELLGKYCVDCHGPKAAKGGLDLTKFETEESIVRGRDQWETLLAMVEDGEMPPEGKPEPTEAERGAVVGWVQARLSQVDCNLINPGRVTLRRLNRIEYRNTVRDLLAVDFDTSAVFPADNVGYGFDTIGDVLTLDPLLMEKYLDAAGTIAERAIDIVGPSAGPKMKWDPNDLNGGNQQGPFRTLASSGEITKDHRFPGDGLYLLRIRAAGDQAGPEPVKMAVKLDGQVLETIDVPVDRDNVEFYEVQFSARRGRHRIAVEFLNDYYKPDDPDPKLKGDRNLAIRQIDLQGPGDPISTLQVEKSDKVEGGEKYKSIGRILASQGEMKMPVRFGNEGEYRIRVRAFGQQAGPEPVKMTLLLDGKPVETFVVSTTEDQAGTYEIRQIFRNTKKTLSIRFDNDYLNTDHPNPERRGDRNLVVDMVQVVGPVKAYYETLPESQKRVILDQPLGNKRDEVTRAILHKLANRAYRRPATDAEIQHLIDLTEMVRQDGGTFEEGIRLAVQAVLVSPHFLFRVEYAGAPKAGPGSVAAVEPLGDFDLANRLSYFLWSSMPDQELFQAALAGKLRTTDGLAAQARRMLKDPRSAAMVENFARQWLHLGNLQNATPDPGRFPSFNNDLRRDMTRETTLFFDAVLREDRSILDFLDADYSFLNERLAKHYGVEGVTGEEFRRVSLDPSRRGGLITQASVLTATSNPTRTSPVKRGKWILEQLLGTPPPPPPPNVPELEEAKAGEKLTGTLRQRMEQHRNNPDCAACHNRMDPLGFGLENYDAVGAWRDSAEDAPIDASGTLPSGQSFAGPGQLKAILKAKKDEFARCLAEKLMTYGLGRGLEYYDHCAVDKIVSELSKDDYRFSSLVIDIVTSDPFRMRAVEGRN